ncbi:hypothetical protein MRB53_038957 [Persea americana]|nr:hypothetical protein MRB53_038957 [Persea americana]
MKIIITGATGYIGGGVLQRALKVDQITEVVVLSRREIDIKHAKLKTIIKKDFATYNDEELSQLKGSQGCIWSLGSPGSSLEIKMGYPRAALKAFTEHLVPQLPEKTPFRFILTSGEAIIADQKRWLPPGFEQVTRTWPARSAMG